MPIKASEFFASQAQPTKTLSDQTALRTPQEVADAVAKELLDKLGKMGMKPGDPNYREMLTGAAQGAAAEYKKDLKNYPEGSKEMHTIKAIVDKLHEISTNSKKDDKKVEELKKLTDRNEKSFDLFRKEKVTDRFMRIAELEKENLHSRGKLVDLEEKQRQLYEKNIAKAEVASKLVFEQTNRALEQLNKFNQETADVQQNFSKEQLKLLQAIHDLLESSKTAPTEALPQVKAELDKLVGMGKSIAERSNNPQFSEAVAKSASIARQATQGPGIHHKLLEYVKETSKNTLTNIYREVTPRPIQMVADALVPHIGKLFERNKERDNERLNEARGYYSDLERQRQRTIEEGDRYRMMRGQGSRGSWRNPNILTAMTAGLGRNPDQVSSADDGKTHIRELHIESLIVDKHNLLSGQNDEKREEILQNESDKHNLVKDGGKGEGKGLLSTLLGGFLSKFKGLFSTFFSPLKGILSGITSLGSLALKWLPMLGRIGAVGAAATAGYEFGKHVVVPALDKLAQIVTGKKDTSFASESLDAFDRLQQIGLAPGVSDKDKMKMLDKFNAEKTMKQRLQSQDGKLTSAQAKTYRDMGAEIPKDVVIDDSIKPAWTTVSANTQPAQTAKPAQIEPGAKANAEDMKHEPAVRGKDFFSVGKSAMAEAASMFGIETDDNTAGKLLNMQEDIRNAVKVKQPFAVEPPSSAISTRTDMVDAGSRTNEDLAIQRAAKPQVIVNNVGQTSKSSSGLDLPIGMGSSRNQENAFADYLKRTFAPM